MEGAAIVLPLEVAPTAVSGMAGMGNATLKRGRESCIPAWKVAGGERLSGEALGGVRGAYDKVGMLIIETGV